MMNKGRTHFLFGLERIRCDLWYKALLRLYKGAIKGLWLRERISRHTAPAMMNIATIEKVVYQAAGVMRDYAQCNSCVTLQDTNRQLVHHGTSFA